MKIKFYGDNECPHNDIRNDFPKLHPTHITADGRSIAVCIMTEQHLQSTIDYLYKLLGGFFKAMNELEYNSFQYNQFSVETRDIEKKIQVLKHEQHRRKASKARKEREYNGKRVSSVR